MNILSCLKNTKKLDGLVSAGAHPQNVLLFDMDYMFNNSNARAILNLLKSRNLMILCVSIS
jgi:hypothetical protein